jgi:membrane protease YdiL (CAAX protease family)
MFAEPSEPSARPDADLLAPRWHTYSLIALMVAVATVGSLLDRGGAAVRAPAASGRIAGVYLPMLLVQWGLFFYVCRVGRSRSALRGLLGPAWAIADGLAANLAWAGGVGLFIEASEWTFGRLGVAHGAALSTILPRTGVERLAWVIVAVSVGICEEVVYRGYLQTQLGAFTCRPWTAVVLQALLFGIAHGEQGLAAAARFAVYAVALGGLARWRRSLLPCMICHVGIDLAGGLLAHPMR